MLCPGTKGLMNLDLTESEGPLKKEKLMFIGEKAKKGLDEQKSKGNQVMFLKNVA